MQVPPDHPREDERLALLRACGVLDTAPEPDFDGLVDLASAIAGTPIALVSLVDQNRQWFKAHHGLDATETPRSVAFCAHAILTPDQTLVVPDALQDPRFHDNPLVVDAPRVVFYAGVPLRVGPDRLPVGTLCVIDHHPRDLSPAQQQQLELLARQVEMLLDLRRRQRSLEQRLLAVRRSEEQMQAIVTAMDEGLVVQDRQGAIVSCNRAAERILGLSQDQMCGRTSIDPRWRAVHPDGSPFPDDEHPSMVTLRTGQPLSEVVMGVGLDGGDRRWILINSQPVGVRDATGRPESVATTFTDITRLRQEEEERRRAEGRVARFLALSQDLMCVADTHGRFLQVNRAWTDALGWSEAELLAQPYLALVHPDDQAVTLRESEHLARGGVSVRFENRYRHRDGGWRVLQWIANGFPEEGVMFGLARDVTDDRERESRLTQEKQRAEDADRAKSTFLATMSHEIRTPMNGVLGMAEALAESPLDRSQRDMVDTIRRSGKALLAIINDILDWSKIQAGKLEILPESVLLAPVIVDVLTTLWSVAGEKHLTLATEDRAPGVAVRADPLRLRQIITNLVGNALKFTDKGSVTVAIDATAEAVQIAVRDTGIGIPADHLPRLFSRFTQVDDANSRRFGGTGLGLAISLQLAEAMGGTIVVHSTPGQGSVFTVTLPRTEAPAATPATTTRVAAPAARPLRLLMAEDNPVNRKVAELLLKRMGHEVTSVTDGQGVLEADLTGIDAILMDVQMPGMDGLEATRRLRQREASSGLHRLPILALTASAMQEERAACLEAGMDVVLTKPIEADVLRRTLAGL